MLRSGVFRLGQFAPDLINKELNALECRVGLLGNIPYKPRVGRLKHILIVGTHIFGCSLLGLVFMIMDIIERLNVSLESRLDGVTVALDKGTGGGEAIALDLNRSEERRVRERV